MKTLFPHPWFALGHHTQPRPPAHRCEKANAFCRRAQNGSQAGPEYRGSALQLRHVYLGSDPGAYGATFASSSHVKRSAFARNCVRGIAIVEFDAYNFNGPHQIGHRKSCGQANNLRSTFNRCGNGNLPKLLFRRRTGEEKKSRDGKQPELVTSKPKLLYQSWKQAQTAHPASCTFFIDLCLSTREGNDVLRHFIWVNSFRRNGRCGLAWPPQIGFERCAQLGMQPASVRARNIIHPQ